MFKEDVHFEPLLLATQTPGLACGVVWWRVSQSGGDPVRHTFRGLGSRHKPPNPFPQRLAALNRPSRADHFHKQRDLQCKGPCDRHHSKDEGDEY